MKKLTEKILFAGIIISSVFFAATASAGKSDVLEQIVSFHVPPDPSKIEQLITYMEQSEEITTPEKSVKLLVGLSCLFDPYRETQYINRWRSKITGYKKISKDIISEALNQPSPAMFSLIQNNPVLPDLYWICYKANGNTQYIRELVDSVAYIENRDKPLYLIGAVSQLILAQNISHTPMLQELIQSRLENIESPELQQQYQLILYADIAVIKAQIINRLKNKGG